MPLLLDERRYSGQTDLSSPYGDWDFHKRHVIIDTTAGVCISHYCRHGDQTYGPMLSGDWLKTPQEMPDAFISLGEYSDLTEAEKQAIGSSDWETVKFIIEILKERVKIKHENTI